MPRTALTLHLTPRQAAEILGVTTDHLRYLVATGKLTPTVTPLGKVYNPDQVERLRSRRADLAARGKKVGRPTISQRAA